MKLDDNTVREIAGLLVDTRSVPMPGGHGVRFAGLRERQKHFGQHPAVAVRCAVAILMLGSEPKVHGRFIRKGWWPVALIWFDQYASAALIARAGPCRWQYLLSAMELLASEHDVSIDAAPAFANLQEYERSRARGPRKPANKSDADVAGDPASDGSTLKLVMPAKTPTAAAAVKRVVPARYNRPTPKDGQPEQAERMWAMVAKSLASNGDQEAAGGDLADRVLLLYTLHTLHASLGLPQHSLASHHDFREKLYGRLALLIRGASDGGCGACSFAHRMAHLLESSRACGGTDNNWRMLERRLPSYFRPAHLYSGATLRSTLNRRLPLEHAERELLLAAHDLGEAVADRLIDPLRLCVGGAQHRLDDTDYILMLNIIKDGRRTYERAAQAGGLPPDDDPRDGTGFFIRAKDVFEHIVDLSNAAAAAAKVLQEHRTWGPDLTSGRCALCFTSSNDRGVSR